MCVFEKCGKIGKYEKKREVLFLDTLNNNKKR